MQIHFELVETSRLRSHEEIRPELLDLLIREIKSDGYLKKPILVENRLFVILDGHHRFEALKKIGCRLIPVYLVDYFDEAIYLTTWPGAKYTNVTKDDVLERGRKGELYPPKTTRHIVNQELKETHVKLSDLM